MTKAKDRPSGFRIGPPGDRDRYELHRALGQGGEGQVWLGTDHGRKPASNVVVKTILHKARGRRPVDEVLKIGNDIAIRLNEVRHPASWSYTLRFTTIRRVSSVSR